MISGFLIFWIVATPIETGSCDDDHGVIAAALASYFNVIHGGTGVAFPEQRRPVLLHRNTVAPSRMRLRVRVASPANRAATDKYSAPRVQRLVARLQERSAHSQMLQAAPRGYVLGDAQLTRCGPQHDRARFADSVAVSRPAFHGRDVALVYVEFAGGAYAYHASRKEATWEIDWYVALWACG